MSIILKGIDLPKDCTECPLEGAEVDGDGFDYWYCKITESTIGIEGINKRPSNCPLIQISKGHGRIIDEKEAVRGWCKGCAFNDGICGNDGTICEDKEMCKYAPTILEAEE